MRPAAKTLRGRVARCCSMPGITFDQKLPLDTTTHWWAANGRAGYGRVVGSGEVMLYVDLKRSSRKRSTASVGVWVSV